MTNMEEVDQIHLDPSTAFANLPPNVLTPHLIAYVLVTTDTGQYLAVELSEGEGILGGDLYGVSVMAWCPVHGWEPLPGASKSVWTLEEASQHISELGELTKVVMAGWSP